MPKLRTLLLLFCITGLMAASHPPDDSPPVLPPAGVRWVDSVFRSLTPEERIAQLFMVPAYSNVLVDDSSTVSKLIAKYNVGGVCFFQGGPLTQARYTNYFQSIARTPLLIAIDGEWGLGMRLKDSTVSFPRQMTLGAIQDEKMIHEMGEEIGNQCKRLGIHIDFAPVVDINSNPANPVINYRSFGEDKENVTVKALAYMKGLQDKGIIATAKHFPGHGDTDKDSHTTLPAINHTREYIDSVDLYPFKKLIQKGVSSVMAAHLFVPALDTTTNLPSSLSQKVVQDVLIDQLGFKGLIFTDALVMKGASENSKPGEIELKALQAGNDILLMSEDVPHAINYIKSAIDSGWITQKAIDVKCRKVLIYKYKAGLSKKKTVKISGLYEDLNNKQSDVINTRLYQASITIIKNTHGILPLKNLDNQKIAEVSFNADSNNLFAQTVDYYAPVKHYSYNKTFNADSAVRLKQKLMLSNLVIITAYQTSSSGVNNYGLSAEILNFIAEIKKSHRVIINLLLNPYSLAQLADTSEISAILVSYQTNKYTQVTSAEAIFGGIAVDGRLPVTASRQFPVNLGYKTSKSRLSYTLPEMTCMKSEDLKKIDSLAIKGISDTIYPGCQVLVAKDGQVIYYKSFGHHTYPYPVYGLHADTGALAVKNSDLYDLASLTKVVSTTMAVMKLYEQGRISTDSTLKKYLPEVAGTDKAGITIKSLMTHQARLKAWIPFFTKTMHRATPDTAIYHKTPSEDYPLRVADSMYIRKNYQDTILMTIVRSELREKNNYVYSDLGFYLMKRIVERITGESIANYVKKNFYGSLGLATMCYQPRDYFDLSRIVPSEYDTLFRKQVLQGDVNDPGAAMEGGIGGHAGIFSNANDIAILMQMLLNKGEYGDHQYLMPETVEKFTSYQFSGNRRGLGFDKPVLDKKQGGPCCDEASSQSFGHSGFTGTYVWADPEYNLIYVFLSNRTFPYSANNKLVTSGIRTDIQKVIYQAIEKNCK